MSKRLRSQSSERIVVVSGPIGSHCNVSLAAVAAADVAAMGIEAAPAATLGRASGGLVGLDQGGFSAGSVRDQSGITATTSR